MKAAIIKNEIRNTAEKTELPTNITAAIIGNTIISHNVIIKAMNTFVLYNLPNRFVSLTIGVKDLPHASCMI